VRWLLLFALVFQGYIAAAHFHNDIGFLAFGGLSGDPVAELHEARSDGAQKNPASPADHVDDCQICQTLAFGSVTITPTPVVIPIPLQFVVQVETVVDDVSVGHVSVSTCFPRGPPSFISQV
jgi:hypothetical protein